MSNIQVFAISIGSGVVLLLAIVGMLRLEPRLQELGRKINLNGLIDNLRETYDSLPAALNCSVLIALVAGGFSLLLGLEYLFSQVDRNAINKDFDISHDSTITLYGVRGQVTEFEIEIARSVRSLWSSPSGLALEMHSPSSPTASFTANIPPKAKEWNNTIEVGEYSTRNQFSIRGSFTIPLTLEKDISNLSGNLEGTILYPKQIEGGFVEKELVISIPVTLHIVDENEFVRLNKDFYLRKMLQPFSIALLCLAYLVSIIFVNRKKIFGKEQNAITSNKNETGGVYIKNPNTLRAATDLNIVLADRNPSILQEKVSSVVSRFNKLHGFNCVPKVTICDDTSVLVVPVPTDDENKTKQLAKELLDMLVNQGLHPR